MQSPSPAMPGLPSGRQEGRQAFADLVRQALAQAALDGWPSLVLSDPDFADWPLGERAVVASLQAWARAGRRIRFLARDFTPLTRVHPRLVQWRVQWSHLIEAHACPRLADSDLPSALWSPAWAMERLDPLRGTVVAGTEPERRNGLRERLDACWGRGTPSFPATTLGL